MNILTLNAGSNSLKFEIVRVDREASGVGEPAAFGHSLVAGAYDDIAKKHSTFSLLDGKQPRYKEEREIRDHGHATELLLNWIEGGAHDQQIHSLADLERIGHRVVHGADCFSGPVRITDQVIRQIEELEDLAPLHNISSLRVIRATKARLASRVPEFAVFDTVFHRSIPDHAALYPLPVNLTRRHKIRRYGFHGISHRYMMLRYAQIAHRPVNEVKLITLHLEGGSSAAAIQNGRSIDTSMGFTPLEGLMMGTRSGDIDPALVTYLMRKEGLDQSGVEKLLNKQSGLLGVSGMSADTRELREHLSDPSVDLALNIFCYRVRKYIGAYLAVLGGAETIVFGGGIGENTAIVRERICTGLGWCGALLDRERNNTTLDREAPITTPESALQVWVIPTQQGLMMASDIAGCE
jgi:acetate kinase